MESPSPFGAPANLHVVERRMIAFLHQASLSTGLDKLLAQLSGSHLLPLPGLLEAWQLAELARLHNSSATLFRAEIKRTLMAQAQLANMECPPAPLALPHSDTELMMILDADCSSWHLLQNLLSLQLFHLQRASALTREMKLRQQQQQQQAGRLKRCPSEPALPTAGLGIPRRSSSSSSRYPRRSFELQLPAVYE